MLGVFYLPPLQDAFDVTPLSPSQWAAVAGLSIVPLLVIEAMKLRPREGVGS